MSELFFSIYRAQLNEETEGGRHEREDIFTFYWLEIPRRRKTDNKNSQRGGREKKKIASFALFNRIKKSFKKSSSRHDPEMRKKKYSENNEQRRALCAPIREEFNRLWCKVENIAAALNISLTDMYGQRVA